MKWWLAVAALCAALPAAALDKADALVVRGRYIVQTSGCNDCHTPAYPANGGNIPETQWLTGVAIGWRGPWGTTYATNLRLYMQQLNEEAWLKRARNLSARPPMPWFAIQAMTDDDLRAIYRYVRSLGAAGKPAPEYVPPLVTPRGPYVQFPLFPL
jgi:mono/diheme cytochrome c family protein